MIYKQTHIIGIEEIDSHCKATNRALLVAMENIACAYSANVGYGARDIETKKRAWILLQWKIQVLKRPFYNEKIEVITWSRSVDKLFAYRDYEIRYENGELLAIGTSKWLLMDTERKRAVRITQDVMELYENENKSVFEKNEDKIQYDEEELKTAKSQPYTLLRRDFDMHGHMHNINYLDMVYEILPQNVYDTVDFRTIHIEYKKQILPNTVIDCKYYKKDFTHYVIVTSDEGIHSIIALTQADDLQS